MNGQEIKIIRGLEVCQKYFRDAGGVDEYPGAVLNGARVILIIAGSMTNWEAWRDLRKESAEFLHRYDPPPPDYALTRDYYFSLLQQWWRGWAEGTDYIYQIFLRDADGKAGELVGDIGLGKIQRGSVPTAEIGYSLGERYARQGFMTEAARLVIDFGFNTLKLHRIEASPAMENTASVQLLKRLGFAPEGEVKAVRINENHALWSKMRT